MSNPMTVTITPAGGSPTTLCDGFMRPDSSHWASLACSAAPTFASQVGIPMRASVPINFNRVTVVTPFILRVVKLFATPAAAKQAELLIGASVVTTGVIVVNCDGGTPGTLATFANCVLESVSAVSNGCQLTVQYNYKTGGVS